MVGRVSDGAFEEWQKRQCRRRGARAGWGLGTPTVGDRLKRRWGLTVQGLGCFSQVGTKWYLRVLVTPGFKDIVSDPPQPRRHSKLWSPLRRGGTRTPKTGDPEDASRCPAHRLATVLEKFPLLNSTSLHQADQGKISPYK